MVEFKLETMMKLAEEDSLIQFMVNGLGGDECAYRVVFNSEVLEDSLYEEKYLELDSNN
ncbi:hypothetical protein [Bacillus manliponensis]|uniref:hypothetical protein n=1 Tax=Bacillus manliponensis TaxID=574376 RepID=UPI000AA743AF|nr:hypothetical protein [Bacillus manliponensis]